MATSDAILSGVVTSGMVASDEVTLSVITLGTVTIEHQYHTRVAEYNVRMRSLSSKAEWLLLIKPKRVPGLASYLFFAACFIGALGLLYVASGDVQNGLIMVVFGLLCVGLGTLQVLPPRWRRADLGLRAVGTAFVYAAFVLGFYEISFIPVTDWWRSPLSLMIAYLIGLFLFNLYRNYQRWRRAQRP